MMAKLFDALVRHQIYLEGVKANEVRNFNEVIRMVSDDIKKQFALVSGERLSDMSRTRLKNFIKVLKDKLRERFSVYTARLLRFLRKFLEVDRGLVIDILQDDSPQAMPIYNDEEEQGILWASLLTMEMGANGQQLLSYVNGLTPYALVKLEQLIRMNYANNEPIAVALRSIVGTEENKNRDGLLGRIFNGARTTINTAVQFVASGIMNAVGPLFFGRYRWVSVIDSQTTDICRSRNGNIYEFGRGPIPPAHENCRSHIEPIRDTSIANPPPSFYSWLSNQPAPVQNDAVGRAVATKLRKGEVSAKDITRFEGTDTLTLEEFLAKRKLILS